MDKKTVSISLILLAIVIVAIIVVFQPIGMITGEGYVIKIGYKPNSNYIPLFVALENGYFEEEGVEVETIRFDSTNAIMDAFIAGNLDATPIGNVVVSYSAEIAQPGLFKMYNFDFYTDERHSENIVARKGSGVRIYQDLEGKVIGVNKGIFARTMVKKFLEQQGIKDFKIIELGDKVQIEALETDQIDVLVSLEPNPTTAVEMGIAEYVESGSIYKKAVGFSPAFSAGIISTKLLNEHLAEAKKFLSAMEKSTNFINENFERAKRILPRYVPIEANIAEKTNFAEMYFIGDLTEEQKELIQKTADFFTSEGIIKERVDTASLLLSLEYVN